MSRDLDPCQRIERSLICRYRRVLWNPFVAAVQRYELIAAGDRVAVCVSGGKDSMLLAKLMQELQRHGGTPFTLRFLALAPGYTPEIRSQLEENAALLRLPLTLFSADILRAAEAEAKNACYRCARMRRGWLYRCAREMGCNKIALGHHLNDVIETALLSMLYTAQLETMPPKARSAHYQGMELIRPLYCVREADIVAWARANGLHFQQCACAAAARESVSGRREVKKLIDTMRQVNPQAEQNLFQSLHAVRLDTLPGYKSGGKTYAFPELYETRGGE